MFAPLVPAQHGLCYMISRAQGHPAWQVAVCKLTRACNCCLTCREENKDADLLVGALRMGQHTRTSFAQAYTSHLVTHPSCDQDALGGSAHMPVYAC